MDQKADPAPAPVLEVRDLAIERGDVPILSGIDWRIGAGEHWALLGPNGSGKSSLLHALLAYLSPTRGSISVLGAHYGETDWRDLRRRIGIVSTAIADLMPVAENGIEVVAGGHQARIGTLGPLGGEEIRRSEEILARVEARHLALRPWRVLSQGERQRLLIGRALVHDPALLILDEPCAGLDPVAREQFLSFLERLLADASGPSLVLTTHHVEELIPRISHALLLCRGKALAQGPKDAVLTDAQLSAAYGAKVRVSLRGDRYGLEVETRRDRVC